MKPGLIFNELGETVGFITSTTKSFTLNKFIALGYANPSLNLEKLYTLATRNREKYKVPIELSREHFIKPRYYRSKTT
jgi:glycine cleavage system aminomethyltransferase T